MEKRIQLVARYHYQDGYFVEVSQEDSFIANRDYWLCKRGSAKKLFMFSSPYKNERAEERMILKRIQRAIKDYESSRNAMKYA